MRSSRPTSSGSTAEDLPALFGRSPVVVVSLTGPSHLIESTNAAFLEAIGTDRLAPGLSFAELMTESDDEGVVSRIDEVYRTGELHTGHDATLVLGTGLSARRRSYDLTYEPRRNDSGTIIGVQISGVETTQPKHAQRLMKEQRALVEQIARQAPLGDVLEGMARTIETHSPTKVLVSVLLADADGRHLRHGAAPSLPGFYNEAIDGIAIGEGVGSCGTAAHRREPVVVTDIATDPFWTDFRDLARRAGVAACWSTPILARDGALLGTFAMYHPSPRVPQVGDVALARVFTDTAALAVERHHNEQAKAAAEAQAEAAREDLARALQAEHELRAEAEQRAQAAAELAEQMRNAASAQAAAPHPDLCELGGSETCSAAAEIKVADPWGDAAWGCPQHVEQALINVRSVFIADEELGGLAAYLKR